MRTLSPYAFAAILIMTRIFAISLYVPSEGENPAVTAVCLAVLSVIKMLSLIPLFIIVKNGKTAMGRLTAKIKSALAAIAAAGFLLMICDSFSTAAEAVYPDHFTKIGIAAVFFLIAAYVASMGMGALSRAASISAVTFIIVLSVIFFEMRTAMHVSRINLYSGSIGKEVSRTFRNILSFAADYFIFFALIPYLKGSPAKAAGLYITTDVLLGTVYLLMSASVMGSFWSRSGFSFFSLAYCSQGMTIDRTDGIFLAVSTSCALVCAAALLTVIKDSLKYLFPISSDSRIFLGTALLLTAVILSIIGFGLRIGEKTLLHSAAASAALFIGSVIKMCLPKKGTKS